MHVCVCLCMICVFVFVCIYIILIGLKRSIVYHHQHVSPSFISHVFAHLKKFNYHHLFFSYLHNFANVPQSSPCLTPFIGLWCVASLSTSHFYHCWTQLSILNRHFNANNLWSSNLLPRTIVHENHKSHSPPSIHFWPQELWGSQSYLETWPI